MSLLSELGYGDAGVDAKEVDEGMQSGAMCPEGLHHVVLEGFRRSDAKSGRPGKELHYKVLAGPGKGCEVKDTLWMPQGDSDSDTALKNRVVLFAHRLGLLKRIDKDGKAVYVPIPGKEEFDDVLGAQAIIEVHHEEYTTEKGKKGKNAKVQFAGIYPLDDPKGKNVSRGKVEGVTTPSGGTATTPAAAKASSLKEKLAGI